VKKPKVLKICENCGKEVYKYQSQIKKSKMIFCSQKCQHEWRTGKTGTINNPKGIYKECAFCGKPFYVYPSEISTKKYCSSECKYSYERREGVHAGANCNFWRGGFDEYRGENWHYQRDLARERDHNTCQECGLSSTEAGYEMCVHHKIPFRFFNGDYIKANDLSNLICLCRRCHQKQESHRWYEVPKEFKHIIEVNTDPSHSGNGMEGVTTRAEV